MIDAATNASECDGKPANYDHVDFVLMARHHLEGWSPPAVRRGDRAAAPWNPAPQ